MTTGAWSTTGHEPRFVNYRESHRQEAENRMIVRVDNDRCQGHQMCAIAAPAVFGADDYGNAVVLLPDGEVPAKLEGDALRAEANCPEHAVLIDR